MDSTLDAWLEAKALNPVMHRLAQGLPVALGICAARTSEIVRIAKATGHHAVWVNLGHSSMSVDVAASLCAAALDLQLTPFARISERDYGINPMQSQIQWQRKFSQRAIRTSSARACDDTEERQRVRHTGGDQRRLFQRVQ